MIIYNIRMNEKIFFIILIIFLLTNEFYFVIKNVIKYGGYLILIIYILKIVSPDLSTKVKSKVIDSLDEEKNTSIVPTILSYGASFLKNIFF
jgi:hypothetical protein